MLKKKRIPTPLIHPEERQPIKIDDIASAAHLRVGYLLMQLLKLGGQLLWLKLRGKAQPTVVGQLLGHFFQKMGVLWIKIGQLLSLRVDILPAQVCEELSKLQDQAHGFDPVLSRQQIEDDLGAPLEEYFSVFADTPFAAASISQVHRAYLKQEKVWVAVKVRKPDAHKTFLRDIAVIRVFIRLLGVFAISPHMRWSDMLWEIEQLMEEELDYHYEIANMQRMKKTLRRHRVYVPKVYSKYSSKRILVMEFVQGALMSDYLKIAYSDPNRLAAWRKENNISTKRLGQRLFFSNLRQLFEDNLFHGDLHPGNIVLLRDSQIAFIDFGSIGFSDQDFLKKYSLYMEALVNRQYAKVFDLYLLFPDNIPATDLSRLKESFTAILQAWQERSQIKELPYKEKNVSSVNDEVIALLGEYKITMTWSILRFMRASTTLDAAIRELIPDISVITLMKRYFRQRNQRVLKRMLDSHKEFDSTQLTTLIDAPISLNESMVFRGSVVRRLAQVFEGTSSKITQGFYTLLTITINLLRFSGLYLLLVFLTQYGGMALPEAQWLLPLHWSLILDIQIWFIIFACLLYIERTFAKLCRICREV